MGYTASAEFEAGYKTLFSTFASGKTKDPRWRTWQLKQIWWLIDDNENAIIEAINQDLRRPAFETYAIDLASTRNEILAHIRNLEKWAADTARNASFIFGKLGRSRIHKEPLGVALIIGAWNFPLGLVPQPLVSAIVAGNCAIIKPPEVVPTT
jgi:aldehyde dehydrogenase (NAD+)